MRKNVKQDLRQNRSYPPVDWWQCHRVGRWGKAVAQKCHIELVDDKATIGEDSKQRT